MKKYIVIDGAMGTYVRTLINDVGRTDLLSITNREVIKKIHKQYINSGAEIITTNTFITNYLWDENNVNAKEIIKASIDVAKEVISESNKKISIALDITQGKNGINNYNDIIDLGVRYNVDYFLLETMTSLREAEKWILEIKKKCTIPIICSFTFRENRKLKDGSTILEVCNKLNGLDVKYIGANCGLGLEHAYNIASEIKKYTHIPIMVKPNLGYPNNEGEYETTIDEFKLWGDKYKEIGCEILGGCCGTTPEYIKILR
ncbi:MAG: homocysteine S-methyltransferase family protein [Clostridium sp.]